MEFLSALWMPIVISAVLVWITSAIMHMVLPHHKGDFKGLPDEGKLFEAIQGVAPGQYMFPWCASMADMKSPAYLEKQAKGPNGHMTIWAGPVNMGKNLMLMLAFYLLTGVFVAYMASHAFSGDPAAPDYLAVFRMAGVGAFMAHGLGWMPNFIWFGGKGFWAYLFDAIVYALVTAGTFAWLWPGRV